MRPVARDDFDVACEAKSFKDIVVPLVDRQQGEHVGVPHARRGTEVRRPATGFRRWIEHRHAHASGHDIRQGLVGSPMQVRANAEREQESDHRNWPQDEGLADARYVNLSRCRRQHWNEAGPEFKRASQFARPTARVGPRRVND
jgi:hypothetical protein